MSKLKQKERRNVETEMKKSVQKQWNGVTGRKYKLKNRKKQGTEETEKRETDDQKTGETEKMITRNGETKHQLSYVVV